MKISREQLATVSFLLTSALVLGGILGHNSRVEEVNIKNTTMSAIVFADTSDTVDGVEAKVVFDDSLINNVEGTMKDAVNTASNTYIAEEEARVKAELEAKRQEEARIAEAKRQEELKRKQSRTVNITYAENNVSVNTYDLSKRLAKFAPNDDLNKTAVALAKMVYGEGRGLNDTEKAAIIWCVLNRYDAGYANTIYAITSNHGQFHGYLSSNPVWDNLLDLSYDVISRWVLEKEGNSNVGRVLPQGYLWFYGDGSHNHYRNQYRGGTRWDWSLPSPY